MWWGTTSRKIWKVFILRYNFPVTLTLKYLIFEGILNKFVNFLYSLKMKLNSP